MRNGIVYRLGSGIGQAAAYSPDAETPSEMLCRLEAEIDGIVVELPDALRGTQILRNVILTHAEREQVLQIASSYVG